MDLICATRQLDTEYRRPMAVRADCRQPVDDGVQIQRLIQRPQVLWREIEAELEWFDTSNCRDSANKSAVLETQSALRPPLQFLPEQTSPPDIGKVLRILLNCWVATARK